MEITDEQGYSGLVLCEYLSKKHDIRWTEMGKRTGRGAGNGRADGSDLKRFFNKKTKWNQDQFDRLCRNLDDIVMPLKPQMAPFAVAAYETLTDFEPNQSCDYDEAVQRLFPDHDLPSRESIEMVSDQFSGLWRFVRTQDPKEDVEETPFISGILYIHPHDGVGRTLRFEDAIPRKSFHQEDNVRLATNLHRGRLVKFPDSYVYMIGSDFTGSHPTFIQLSYNNEGHILHSRGLILRKISKGLDIGGYVLFVRHENPEPLVRSLQVLQQDDPNKTICDVPELKDDAGIGLLTHKKFERIFEGHDYEKLRNVSDNDGWSMLSGSWKSK